MSVHITPHPTTPTVFAFSLRSMLAVVAVFAVVFWALSEAIFEEQWLGMTRGQYQVRADVEELEPKLTEWLNARGFDKVSHGDSLVEASTIPRQHVFYGPLEDGHPVTLIVAFRYYPIADELEVGFELDSRQPRKLVFTHDAHRKVCHQFLDSLKNWCEDHK